MSSVKDQGPQVKKQCSMYILNRNLLLALLMDGARREVAEVFNTTRGASKVYRYAFHWSNFCCLYGTK